MDIFLQVMYSVLADLSNGLLALLSLRVQVPQTDYAISGGVHDGKAIVKAILAGASAVELCSVIYQKAIVGHCRYDNLK